MSVIILNVPTYEIYNILLKIKNIYICKSNVYVVKICAFNSFDEKKYELFILLIFKLPIIDIFMGNNYKINSLSLLKL